MFHFIFISDCIVADRLKTQLDKAKKQNQDAQKKYRDLQKRVSSRMITKQQFRDHTEKCVKPGLDYFRQKFVEDDAPLKRAMDIYCAATVCDPTKLKSMTLVEAQVHAHTYMFDVSFIYFNLNMYVCRVMFKC